MAANRGLNWKGSDFLEVVVQSALCLRTAMTYRIDESDSGSTPRARSCQVKKWVDAKLLEMLWAPCGDLDNVHYFAKDIVRSEISKLTPKMLWGNNCGWSDPNDPQKCPVSTGVYLDCYAGSLLPRVLLGPMDWFFECEEDRYSGSDKEQNKGIIKTNEGPLLWVVAKLYDQLGDINFYRTLSGMEVDDPHYQTGQLLFRVPEVDYEWFKDWIADFSTLLRIAEDKTEVDYCLVCTRESSQLAKEQPDLFPEGFHWYDISEIMARVDSHQLVQRLNVVRNKQVSEVLSQRILTPKTLHNKDEPLAASNFPNLLAYEMFNLALYNEDIKIAFDRVKHIYENCLYAVPGHANGKDLPPDLRDRISDFLDELMQQTSTNLDKGDEGLYPRLANYFIWLKAIHPDLTSYTIRYAANYRFLSYGGNGNDSPKRLQNPCFVVASKKLPSRRLLAALRISMTYCLGPLEDYYAIHEAKADSENQTKVRIADKEEKARLARLSALTVNEFAHVELNYVPEVVEKLQTDDSLRKIGLELLNPHMKERTEFLRRVSSQENAEQGGLSRDIPTTPLVDLVDFYRTHPIVLAVPDAAEPLWGFEVSAKDYYDSYKSLLDFNCQEVRAEVDQKGAVRTIMSNCLNNPLKAMAKVSESLLYKTIRGNAEGEPFQIHVWLHKLSNKLGKNADFQLLIADNGPGFDNDTIVLIPEWIDGKGFVGTRGFGFYWIARACGLLGWDWELWSLRENIWTCVSSLNTQIDNKTRQFSLTKPPSNVRYVHRFIRQFRESDYIKFSSGGLNG